MKIIELKVDDTNLAGVDAVALVEYPAIELDFVAFNKVNMAELTHNDYPQAAVNAAKRGIELNEKYNNKCATQVGKVRAQQLVDGEKLSLDTIKRMRSFLIRQKGNYELATRRKDYSACGYISYLLWGGEAALPWAEKKLRQAGIEFAQYGELKSNIPQMPPNEPVNFSDEIADELLDMIIAELLGLDEEEDFNVNVNQLPNYVNEASTGKKRNFAQELKEKQMLVGPLMTPNKLIPRVDEETGEEYQVFFSKDTIEQIAYKMMQDKLVDAVNIEHDGAQRVNDVYLVETWLVKDAEKDKASLYGFSPVEGEWYGMYKVNNKPVWDEYVKTGKVKGFSVEGYFYNNVLTTK